MTDHSDSDDVRSRESGQPPEPVDERPSETTSGQDEPGKPEKPQGGRVEFVWGEADERHVVYEQPMEGAGPCQRGAPQPRRSLAYLAYSWHYGRPAESRHYQGDVSGFRDVSRTITVHRH